MDLSNLTVLIVEDSANVRFTVKAMLHEMGITSVQEASDGNEALQYIKGNPTACHLVLCDWNMPNKTGLDFLKEVRRFAPDLPFIMITARADKSSILTALSTKVTAYIRKPFKYEDLQEKIAAIFR